MNKFLNIWTAPCENVFSGICEGPYQSAHPRSLIRDPGPILSAKKNHWILQNVGMESKSPDDTLRMRRMI